MAGIPPHCGTPAQNGFISEEAEPMGAYKYQAIYVRVPRAYAEQYWHKPWAEVLAAAERGDDGLCVTARPKPWIGTFFSERGTSSDPDVAFLAEGQEAFVGKTVLFQQNW